MCDVDFLALEFYSRTGVMLCDYKHWSKRDDLFIHTASHDALAWLADGREIPFAICLYNLEASPPTFEVIPVNQTAREFFGGRRVLDEEDWVRCQHHLRGLAQDEQLEKTIQKLKDEAPVIH